MQIGMLKTAFEDERLQLESRISMFEKEMDEMNQTHGTEEQKYRRELNMAKQKLREQKSQVNTCSVRGNNSVR